jgi:hypothetical protein
MARLVRPHGRVSLALSTLFVAGALGCGGKSNTSKSQSALHIVSVPVHAAQVGSPSTYHAVLSKPGAADWTMDQGPHGATVDQGGNVTWTPDDTQGGNQAFKLSATMDGHTTTQTFEVTTASSTMEATAHVDPNDPNGATVTVDAPLSSVQGAAVQMQPGTMPPGEPVAVTISSMQHPPDPPGAAMVSGVSPHDLKPVELGPTGLTFRKPAWVQLPIPQKLVTMPMNLVVQTYDYRSGQWKKVRTTNVDRKAGVATAEIEHFSTYVVTPDVPVFDLKLSAGGTSCAASLIVRAPLVVGFGDVPGSAVNGYAGTATTVAGVLDAMKGGEALQVYTRVRARAAAATGDQTGWSLAAATKQADGTFKVSVVSDAHAGSFLKVPAAGLEASDAELLAWLNGSRVDFVFGALGDLTGGAAASAEASLYLVPASDATVPPPASANAIGVEDTKVTSLASLAGDNADDDCDGAPNGWDPEPAGAAPPVVVGFPSGPARVAVGSTASFKISSPEAGLTYKWAASDPSVTIASAMDGALGSATPSLPGLFRVTVTGTRGTGAAAATAIYSWDLTAEPAAVAAANTAPVVAIGASANIVRAGETVTLTAFGKDAQGTALTYGWAATDATTISSTAGETIAFSAMTPGDYVVTCIANDGSLSSPLATVTVTVLSATANRPPGAPAVSPLSAALTHEAGAPVTLALTAKADDPDMDALTYDFAPDPTTPTTFSLMKSGASATFTSSTDGVYVFYVTATDAKGARGPWTPVKILVLPTLAAQPVDADKDGFPAGFDCNDADPAVHPGAKEICGDTKDQDCDGHDLAVDQCDADGDRFTPAQGDCDDKNAAIGPKMIERCDGIDNNCNQQTDEGFGVGVDCTNGVGACGVRAKTVCSASFVDVVCGGTPGAPKAETCDGIDNDCNGRVDDVPGAAAGGDVKNCGGCGIACTTKPNGLAACVMGGCVSACTAGFVDADRDPANGCECQLTNKGVETCDGVDNDCNGVVDDGAGGVVYTGPANTMGVGVCAAGIQACQGGKLVDVMPQRLPSAEVCDGVDNDCNGKVDEVVDFLNDDRNCGGCGLVCMAGTHCQQGKCPPVTGGVDAGVPPDGGVRQDGGVGGPDAGTGPGSSISACSTGPGTSVCTDVYQDRANCGACGKACAANEYCGGGVCMPLAAINCQTGLTACLDPSGQRLFCTMLANDPRNCGSCGTVCPSGNVCTNNLCQSTGTGGAGGAGGGAGGAGGTGGAADGGAGSSGTCPANAPTTCGAAGNQYCVNVSTAPSDCGICGRACTGGLVCNANVCSPPSQTASCGGFPSCATGCTSFADDPRNCGNCGKACAAACDGGQCVPFGAASFGATCNVNGECAGGMCMDKARYGWPQGFCTSVCDPNLPCPGGQTCVGSSDSAGYGTCRQKCAADVDCGRAGFVCAAGACQPDCRQNPVCRNGDICDASGRCQPAPTTCTQPQVSCPMPGGSGIYCSDLAHDQMNCGACGRFCPGGTYCNNGVCAAQTCTTPATSCAQPGGGILCTDLSRDPANCGACGKVCATNAICTNGACQGGDGKQLGVGACPAPGGGALCTSLLSDPMNCGACGVVCAGGQGCFNGICGSQTQTCAAGMQVCTDASGQKQYCSDPRYDSGNCGKCGLVCAAGTSCVNGACQTSTSADGGASACVAPSSPCPNGTGGTVCTTFMMDPSNCGACGRVCPGGTYCADGACLPVSDGGTQQPIDAGTGSISCPAGQAVCDGTYCADFMKDPQNCGACHVACTGTLICYQGKCM